MNNDPSPTPGKFCYHWAKDDQDKLVAAGISEQLLVDIPVCAGACREAQAIWIKELNTRQQAEQEWIESSPKAYDLQDLLGRGNPDPAT